MSIAFLHTAALHQATFDRLLAERAFHGAVRHLVREDLLQTARDLGLDTVAEDVTGLLTDLARNADAVVCTCSTLGPLADRVAERHPQVMRIDRPLMEAALTCGPDILLAYCLESTSAPSLDLLADCARVLDRPLAPRPLLCAHAWTHFERGDMQAYAAAIARAIEAEITARGRPDCILLAQASMQVAAPLLGEHGLPVLTSPPLAAERAIALTR